MTPCMGHSTVCARHAWQWQCTLPPPPPRASLPTRFPVIPVPQWWQAWKSAIESSTATHDLAGLKRCVRDLAHECRHVMDDRRVVDEGHAATVSCCEVLAHQDMVTYHAATVHDDDGIGCHDMIAHRTVTNRALLRQKTPQYRQFHCRCYSTHALCDCSWAAVEPRWTQALSECQGPIRRGAGTDMDCNENWLVCHSSPRSLHIALRTPHLTFHVTSAAHPTNHPPLPQAGPLGQEALRPQDPRIFVLLLLPV